MPTSVRYHFIQRFVVSAQEAFDWCSDFDSQDNLLMGDERAKRQIAHLAYGATILKDSFNSTSGTLRSRSSFTSTPINTGGRQHI